MAFTYVVPDALLLSKAYHTTKKARSGELRASGGYARGEAGNVLLSHKAAPAVSLGLEGLTTVFGMGTGVSPPL